MADILANKYRPKKLSDLIGQPSIVTTLTNSIEMNSIHHAYLFHGNLGCGKSTTARIFAAMINCEKGPTVSPCAKCPQCKAIFSNKHSDIVEIDAASGGKIDQIRELRKSAYYAPIAGARKKFYIIEECHSASSDAEEALLRVIEEPPSHVVFIMTTTEFQKMRSTIVSRCQTHCFQKVYWTQIVDHLKIIAKKEKLNVDEEIFKICAISAAGSVRNALQDLNKLITYAGTNRVTADMARRQLGVVGHDVYFDLLLCIVNNDGKPDPLKAYRIINNIFINAVDIRSFLRGLDNHLMAIAIAMTAPAALDTLSLSEEDKKRISNEASRFDFENIDKMMSEINEIYRCLTYGVPIDRLLNQWFIRSVLACHLKEKEKPNEKEKK